MLTPLPTTIEGVSVWLAASKHMVFLTGAGVSNESGIPTFRDALDGFGRSSIRLNWQRLKSLHVIRNWSGTSGSVVVNR